MADRSGSDVGERIAVVHGDITAQAVDAIVNAANESLRGGGGVDGAIHRAAGPGLLAELIERYPDGCRTGEVRPSGGHRLQVRAVLHAVGPVWRGGSAGEAELLASCYRGALALAGEHGLARVAFPAISCGVYGYPHAAAAAVAASTVVAELPGLPAVREVRFVLFTAELRAVFAAAVAAALA